MKLASRLDHIEPFYVMECAKAAVEIARSPACAESPMIFLNIGEPDFTAPPLVQEAAERAVRSGRTQYTDATGLVALRERISGWYATRFGLHIAPRRIVVTAGASAALQLAWELAHGDIRDRDIHRLVAESGAIVYCQMKDLHIVFFPASSPVERK